VTNTASYQREVRRLSGRSVNLTTHMYLHTDRERLNVYLHYYTALSEVGQAFIAACLVDGVIIHERIIFEIL
jgi:hypothetical protein